MTLKELRACDAMVHLPKKHLSEKCKKTAGPDADLVFACIWSHILGVALAASLMYYYCN